MVKEYYRYLSRMILPIAALMLTALVSSFAVFCYPLLEKIIYDTLIITYDKNLLVMVLYATASLVIITLIATLFIEMLSSYIQISLITLIREDMTKRVLHYRYGFFKSCDFGEIVERLIPEVDTVASVITTTVKYATYALQIVLILLITLVLEYRLFIIYVLLVGAHFLWHMKTRELIGKSDRQVRDREGILYSFFYNQIREIKEVKLFNLHTKRLSELDTHQEKSRQATLKSAFMSHIHSIGTYLPRFMFIIVLVLFYDTYRSGETTIGVYFLFTGLLFLLEFPISQVLELGATLEQGKAAVSRISEITGEEREREGALPLRRVHQSISFSNISFSYDTEPILQDISFDINPGDTIALIGASGSGKSTIASLILRLYEPQEGEITIDGQPVSNYTLHSLRERIGILSQEPFLFNESVRVNVDPHDCYPTEQICRALKMAKLAKFTDQLDKAVGENGLQVSMGEKQRIALARLLIRNCSVIIFDEATAHLDPATEEDILQTIAEVRDLNPELITITISHRLASIAHCERVLLLKNGHLLDEGSFQEISQTPLFNQLYKGEGNEVTV